MRSVAVLLVLLAISLSVCGTALGRKHHAHHRIHSRAHHRVSASVAATAKAEMHSLAHTARVTGDYKPAPSDKAWCPDDCKGEDFIVEALKSCKPTPKCCLDLIYETVKYVNTLFSSNKISYWAMKGTLLGAHRDKGIIEHDYDIDLATTLDQLNKITALHDQVWKDGYIMFMAPWPGYNNMNVVIAKRTPVVEKWCKENSITSSSVPKFSKDIREKMISAEVMVFKDIKGQLIQMVCTAHKSGDKWQYEAAVDDSVLHNEFKEDDEQYQRRGKSTDGWLKYADGSDRAFQDYRRKLGPDGTSPKCIRSAPSSFRYEAKTADVLPVTTVKYYDLEISAPKDVPKYLTNYFGPSFMVPKRRYGSGCGKSL